MKKDKLIPLESKVSISEEDFLKIMIEAAEEFSEKLGDFNERINVFNACVKKDRLPNYLMPGGNLLGKYQVEQVVSYRQIIETGMMEKRTVFPPKKMPDNDNQSMVSGRTGTRKRTPGKAMNDATTDKGKSMFSHATGKRRLMKQ